MCTKHERHEFENGKKRDMLYMYHKNGFVKWLKGMLQYYQYTNVVLD